MGEDQQTQPDADDQGDDVDGKIPDREPPDQALKGRVRGGQQGHDHKQGRDRAANADQRRADPPGLRRAARSVPVEDGPDRLRQLAEGSGEQDPTHVQHRAAGSGLLPAQVQKLQRANRRQDQDRRAGQKFEQGIIRAEQAHGKGRQAEEAEHGVGRDRSPRLPKIPDKAGADADQAQAHAEVQPGEKEGVRQKDGKYGEQNDQNQIARFADPARLYVQGGGSF